MKTLFNILLSVVILSVLSACDTKPEVIEKRLFVGEGSPYKLLAEVPATSDSPGIPERLCVTIEDLTSTKASGTEWLKKSWSSPGGGSGPEVGPIGYIVYQIDNQMDKATEEVFRSISDDQVFRDVVQALMVLAIALYGVGLISGIIPMQGYPFIILMLKLSLIFAVVTEYDLFEEIVKDFFDGIVLGLIDILSNTYTGESIDDPVNIFDSADQMLASFFSMEFIIINMALMFTGWTGTFYAITMLLSTIGFLIAVLRAVYVFIRALVVRGLLYVLAPIFITLGMMKYTKSLFDGWMQMLISFTLQPIFLFAFLGLFLEMIKAFKQVLAVSTPEATHVCYMEKWVAGGSENGTLYWWSFSKVDGINSLGGITPDISVDLVILFTFMLLSYVMILFSTWATEVAHHMSQGFVSAAGAAGPGWTSLKQSVMNKTAPKPKKVVSDSASKQLGYVSAEKLTGGGDSGTSKRGGVGNKYD